MEAAFPGIWRLPRGWRGVGTRPAAGRAHRLALCTADARMPAAIRPRGVGLVHGRHTVQATDVHARPSCGDSGGERGVTWGVPPVGAKECRELSIAHAPLHRCPPPARSRGGVGGGTGMGGQCLTGSAAGVRLARGRVLPCEFSPPLLWNPFLFQALDCSPWKASRGRGRGSFSPVVLGSCFLRENQHHPAI